MATLRPRLVLLDEQTKNLSIAYPGYGLCGEGQCENFEMDYTLGPWFLRHK